MPRRVQELYLVTAEAMDTLTNTLGRSPTVNEVAQHIGASDEEVLEALEARAAYRLASIDTPGGDGDGERSTGMQLGDDDPGFRMVDDRLAKAFAPHLERLAGDLADRPHRSAVGAEKHGRTDHALVADGRDLDALAAVQRHDERHRAAQRKVHVGDGLVRLEQ